MPEDKRTIYLYYAEWCGHCKAFKPEWEIIKKKISEIRKSNKNISFEEYEESRNPKEIEKADIKGFPTIRMKFGTDIEDYDGSRKSGDILNYFLTHKTDDDTNEDTDQEAQKYGQCGGGKKIKQPKSKRLTNRDYKIKYAKYKAKYFKLLSNMKF